MGRLCGVLNMPHTWTTIRKQCLATPRCLSMSAKRIMVATDGSAGADRAVEAAAGLAKSLNADLTIATFGGSFSADEIEQLTRAEGQVGEAVELLLNSILRLAKERAERIGAPKIHTHSGWGDAAHSIIDIASRKEVDIVVLGRRGRGRLIGMLFGSTSQKVASLASCIVVIVP